MIQLIIKNRLLIIAALLAALLAQPAGRNVVAAPRVKNSHEQICLALKQAADCVLPENLAQIAQEREAGLQSVAAANAAQSQTEDFFYNDIRLKNTGTYTDYVQVGQPLESYIFLRNDYNMARTATISHELDAEGYTVPATICGLANYCEPNNGFTAGQNRTFGMASGEYWVRTYETAIKHSGFWYAWTSAMFDRPSYPPQHFVRLAGTWGLDIKAEGFGNQLMLHNPNSSPHGGNPFYYKLDMPEGVQLIGAMEHGVVTDTAKWGGNDFVYLPPSSSTELGAVLAAQTAGTYTVTVHVRASHLQWSGVGTEWEFVPAQELYTKQLTLSLPQVDTSKPHLRWVPVEQDVREGDVQGMLVELRREGNITVPFSVTLNIGGSAIEGQDYELHNLSVHPGDNVLSFQPGQVGQLFPMGLLDDSQPEAPDSIIYILRYDGQAIEIDGKGRSTVTILDNDPGTPPPPCTSGFCDGKPFHLALPVVIK